MLLLLTRLKNYITIIAAANTIATDIARAHCDD